jgi:hypothetical protein
VSELKASREGDVLAIRLPAEWDAVKAAWDPCHDMLRHSGVGDDEAYTLCMVAQELLENAVKYGSCAPEVELELRIHVGRDEIEVEAKNPVGVDGAHLRQFDQAIQWIRGFQDPFEAYVERMKIVSAQPYGEGKSGLGLTRIAYEGRCVLDFYVDASNTLAVSAVYRR